MSNDTQLKSTTALTPVEREKAKTRQQKAEDIIYTLNHSITCLSITDTFGLSMAANLYNSIAKNKWHVDEEDHGYSPLKWAWDRIRGKHKDPAHIAKIKGEEIERIAAAKAENELFIAPELTPDSKGKQAMRKFGQTSGRWLISEAIGDLGAVPVTVFLQRHCPNFMQTLRGGIEWATGWAFRKTTTSAAVNWGRQHGFDRDSQEVKDRQHELYEYEMGHMPQMAVWTVASVLMNYGAMHALHGMKPSQFPKTSLKEFAAVKGAGAAMTAALVLGVRGATPGGAHKWDQTIGKYAIVPITKTVGRLFGVRSEDVDSFQKSREDYQAGTKHLVAKNSPLDEALKIEMPVKKETPVIQMDQHPSTKISTVETKGRATSELQQEEAVALRA